MALSFEGFESLTELHRGPSSLVFRGIRSADGRAVIVKTTADTRPSREQVAAFVREGRLARRVRAPFVPELLEQREVNGVPVIVMEDLDVEAIDRVLARRRLGFVERLMLAVGMARALAAVHEAGIIHKDINPSNLVVDERSLEVRVIDFGIATLLERESPTLLEASRLEGTLHYLSPEQTGRMNRRVDRRSDLYSLGVTLYELFTGRRPFDASDPLELVHAHLARTPLPPYAHDDSVGPVISEIVLRLIAKAAEDRYQSASGLLADLTRCLVAYRESKEILAFELGQMDRPGKVEVPEKLYGREPQVETLLAAFTRVASGSRELVSISGYSGIGKTSLVRAVLEPVTARRGVFLEGKFDQFRTTAPYAPLGEAFGRWVRGVLTLDDASIEALREEIAAALGPNAAVLVDVLPELGHLLGPLEPAPELSGTEAENRFHDVFRRLVSQIASERHPLVIFLDDLQWADLPTLRLVERLISDRDAGHLLLIAAYRDNEVDDAHPLAITLERVRTSGHRTEIELGPLSDAAVVSLLAETFDRTDVDRLAVSCAQKTGKNPFFLRRFLKELGEREIVRWDEDQSRWSWDLDAIDRVPHTENLVAFLVAGLAELPAPSRRALACGASVVESSDGFDVRTVASVLGTEVFDTIEALRPAVRAGLVSPLGKGYVVEVGDDVGALPDEAFQYRFEHDRVQQAAYASMTDEEAETIHLTYGRLLEARYLEGDAGPLLFEVADQLNRARGRLDQAEQITLARYDLEAGRRARRAAAFGVASQYFEAGLSCLPRGAWQSEYTLTHALTLESAECGYLTASFALTERRLAEVRAHARGVLDRVGAWAVEIGARISRDDLRGSIAVACEALAPLGIELPEEPTDLDVGAAVQRAMRLLAQHPLESIPSLPLLDDPLARAARSILVTASSPAYFARPALLPIIACELVVSSLERGLSAASPFAFAVYGIVLNAMGAAVEGHAVGKLALELLSRLDARELAARTRLVVHNNVGVWLDPLTAHVDELLDVYRGARESGDFEFAAIAGQSYSTNAFSAGRPLFPLRRDAARLGGFMRNYQQNTVLRLHRPLERVLACFLGEADDPARLDGGDFREDEALAFAETAGSASIGFVTLSKMIIARFHFGDPLEAWAVVERAAPLQAGAQSTYHLVDFHTYAPLVAARAYPRLDAEARRRADNVISGSLQQLGIWAQVGADNHAHRASLVEAEQARLRGESERAEMLLRRALDQVRAAPGYLNDEGLVAERAARFHLERGGAETSIGRAFLEDATFAYERWGAVAKVEALVSEFPQLLGRRAGLNTEQMSGTVRTDRLDVDTAAVVRASRIISAEIEVDELLPTLVRIALEAAGARRALLVLPDEERYAVSVQGDAVGEPTLLSLPLEACDEAEYPVGVLRYVLRTGTEVLVPDAQDPSAPFASDPYVVARQVRSMMCLPLIHRGAITAVLYLDHDELVDVFTEERIALLNLLLGQATVSLENAKLYAEQLRVSRAQSRFVPHQFLDSLARHDIAAVALGDHVAREMSILFSDLRRFTGLVESLGPQRIIALLNDYFAAMEPAIVDHGGFIDSFNGDEIMALFGGSADGAVHAAIAMQRALREFNQKGLGSDRPALRMGVGVNSGPLLLGIVGGRDRIKCGVVGDAVNQASRLERLTKRYGTPVLVGDATYEALTEKGAFSFRVVDRMTLRGQTKPVTVREVLDALPDPERELRERTREGLREAHQRLEAGDVPGAVALLDECLAVDPDDRVLSILRHDAIASRA